ncbi:MAG TPA: hypothetical protein VF603_12785 [Allosphingosinicella sp.]
MNTKDHDKERGRLSSDKPKWASRLVTPRMLKAILAIGPMVAKILRLGIELVKLFKE